MENDYMINSWMKTLEKLAQDNNAEIVGPLSLYAIIPEFINCYSKSTNCSYKGQTPANETSFRNYIAEVITRENEHSICNHLTDYIIKEEAFDESLSKALHHIKFPDPSRENHQADAKAWKVTMGMFDNKLQINSKSLDFTKNLYWKNNRYIFIKTKPTHHPSTAADKKCKTLISDRTSTHKSKADSNKFYLKFVETLSTLDDTEYSVESVQNGVRGKLKEFEHHGIKFTDKTIQGLISDELITKAEIAALEDLYEINIKVIPDQKTGSTKEEFDLKLVRSVQTGTQTSEEHMFSLTNTNPAHIHYAVTSAIGLAAWFCNHNVENFIQLYINICTANNMPILKLPESFINLIIETQKAQSFDWNLLYKAMAYMEQDHAPNEVCLEQSKAANYAVRESKKNDMFKFNQDETNSIINASRNLAETFNIENVVTPLTSPNISASRNPAETDNMENETPSLTELSENLIIDLSDSIVSIEQIDESDSQQGIRLVVYESSDDENPDSEGHTSTTAASFKKTDNVEDQPATPKPTDVNNLVSGTAHTMSDSQESVKLSPNNTVNSSGNEHIIHPSSVCIDILEKSINKFAKDYNPCDYSPPDCKRMSSSKVDIPFIPSNQYPETPGLTPIGPPKSPTLVGSCLTREKSLKNESSENSTPLSSKCKSNAKIEVNESLKSHEQSTLLDNSQVSWNIDRERLRRIGKTLEKERPTKRTGSPTNQENIKQRRIDKDIYFRQDIPVNTFSKETTPTLNCGIVCPNCESVFCKIQGCGLNK